MTGDSTSSILHHTISRIMKGNKKRWLGAAQWFSLCGEVGGTYITFLLISVDKD